MKILHVVPSFYPCFAAGGVVNASYQIAKKQAELGNEVAVITTDSCTNRLKFENRYGVNVDGIKTFYFKNISNKLKMSFLIDTPITLHFKLKNIIKDFDIVHIHEHRHFLAIIASNLAIKNNIPYVIQAHGSVLPFFQKESLKVIFDKLWGYKIIHNASLAFALTNEEKDQYIKMGINNDKIAIVPLGISLNDYKNLPPYGNFRKKYNINNNTKLITFIGRLHKIKGLDVLLEAFKLLLIKIAKETNLDIKLAIIGPDDGFLDELNDKIAKLKIIDDVLVTGPLFGEDKKSALVDLDIFVMPSRYESFTTSGLEAMACGKPLVLTKNNHIRTWVDSNVGLIADFDKVDIADKIFKLLTTPSLMESFGLNGLELIKNKYNWDLIESKIANLYESIIFK
ncbi:glycosyltransferase [Methanobrevibacter filiformis]|uniref:Mannosylfructose-phosphate synthase n=1 Tax=Methanobrevibacter filiformis TaxID=55758 RepID=A0A165YU93_9EURY|nr:glycosyltransferase [Methanobrevibacter filiformis]KZX09873.1 mannosylfructose-phosphate synthase [Methanobrevibacter filiformis]